MIDGLSASVGTSALQISNARSNNVSSSQNLTANSSVTELQNEINSFNSSNATDVNIDFDGARGVDSIIDPTAESAVRIDSSPTPGSFVDIQA